MSDTYPLIKIFSGISATETAMSDQRGDITAVTCG